MPKKSRANEYELSVDCVIETSHVPREGKITVILGAGSARLHLQFEPLDALRLADSILAALRQMGRRSALR
jgi:hypothetical protein